MATKSAKMSQHRRQGANPRGFEDFAGAQDGSEHLSMVFHDAPGLGGGRAETQNSIIGDFKALNLKA